MTTEERFERIEHVTAALAEERRKDRREFKALWRDTQRQLNELSTTVLNMAEELRETDRRLANRIEQLAAESREAAKASQEADTRQGARIEALVSAIATKL
jgi:hypothetical protein